MSPGKVKFGIAAMATFPARPSPVSSIPPIQTGILCSAHTSWIRRASMYPPTRPGLMLMIRQAPSWIASRAAWADVTAGRAVQGGSTITQQLVRNLYTGSEKTFNRKLKEACLAIKLSRKWSKPKILDEYLNTVYYGNHAYGVEAAAQTYFSKHASQLTLLQSALLAGLPQAPSDYDPLHNPRAALARRSEVLSALLANQQITQHQYDVAARSRSLNLKPGRVYSTIKQPYFFSYVIDQLERQYGATTVREGGLKVYTTIEIGRAHV